jgi:acyl-CoA thioester hydrolase
MYQHTTHRRVTYAETDQMGYLYYGRYAEYYEVGRVELIRSLGFSYRDLETQHGIWLPVVSLESRYLRPARYDDLITIKTEVRTLPDTHITFHCALHNEAGKLLNSGRIRLCFFEAATKKVVPMPGFLADALSLYW